MERSPDAIVVGSGIIGTATALELARQGRRVVVLDKGDAVGGGSTSASSSIIRFNYSTLDGCIAAWEAMHQWADWANHLGFLEGPAAQFHRTGMLVVAAPTEDFATVLGHFATVGIPHEVLDADAVGQRFPALDVGSYSSSPGSPCTLPCSWLPRPGIRGVRGGTPLREAFTRPAICGAI